jgi:hypothetical protein
VVVTLHALLLDDCRVNKLAHDQQKEKGSAMKRKNKLAITVATAAFTALGGMRFTLRTSTR